ncbi:MAG: signal peptidase I [Oscillospiraceae bacterium]|jgi:signal peptidase I|nr:signal peptidase I [Oscillospiraceae bacterium]
MEKDNTQKKITFWVSVYSCVDLIVGAVLMGVLLISFLFRQVGVKGTSMLPTLEENQRLIIAINNGLREIKKGDIVVVNQPNIFKESLIKRTIATEGDEIDINFETGTVFVNGVELQEPYINENTYTEEGVEFPQKVPKGCVFVMGDNRNSSTDSRHPLIGMIDTRYIFGKVIFRIWPPNKIGNLK